MAFMGMVFGAVFLIVLVIVLCIIGLLFTVAIILKIVGKVKDSEGARIAGNVFMTIAAVMIAPIILLAGYIYISSAFYSVELPDGRTVKIYHRTVSEFTETIDDYIENGDTDSYEKLETMIRKKPALVYVRDVNLKSILEFGLESGNADIVELALDSGSVLDDPARYDHMSYYTCSLDEYLSDASVRQIEEDDIRIIRLLLDGGCDTDVCKDTICFYSNLFGRAVWTVLYNDDYVTDTELEFIEVITDYGFDHDDSLMLVYDVPSNYLFGPETHEDVRQDENYHELLRRCGLE